MTIELTDRTIGLWYVTFPDTHGQVQTDWLASIYHDEDGQLQMDCRFRHYRDDKTFDSIDKKNWYHIEFKSNDQDEAVTKVRDMVRTFWKASGGKRYEVLMGPGGLETLTHEWMKLPFNTKVQVEG